MPLDLKTINDLYRIAVKIATVAHEEGISEEVKEKLLTLSQDLGHISCELSKELDLAPVFGKEVKTIPVETGIY